METDSEFKQWMNRHWMHLQWYAPDEICRLGLACGFTMSDMVNDVSAWLAKSQRLLRLAESGFAEKWYRAALAQNGHDFD